jgi:hypothetical protein
MSRFVFNEAGMRHVFRAEHGMTGRYVARKAAEVTTHAHNNVLGRPGPRVRSRDLVTSVRFAGMFENARGLYALVGSDAQHDGVPYPRLLELGGTTPQGHYYRYPWLVPALRQAFGRR